MKKSSRVIKLSDAASIANGIHAQWIQVAKQINGLPRPNRFGAGFYMSRITSSDVREMEKTKLWNVDERLLNAAVWSPTLYEALLFFGLWDTVIFATMQRGDSAPWSVTKVNPDEEMRFLALTQFKKRRRGLFQAHGGAYLNRMQIRIPHD